MSGGNMKKQDYGYSYDYSGLKPMHRFVNEQSEASITIFKELNGYVLLQKSKTGHQQRLKLDDSALTKMLSMFDKNGWIEQHA